MKELEKYREEDRLEEVSKDLGKARGLAKRSNKRLNNERGKGITRSNAFQILENIYEALREIMEAWMALKGYESEDHVATIAWSSVYLEFDRSTVNKLHKFRKLRNASRYEAEEITPEQAREIIEFAESFIESQNSGLREAMGYPSSRGSKGGKEVFTGVIGIVYREDDPRKFVLIHNIGTGNITFPAGAREIWEKKPQETLEREIREETGLEPLEYDVKDTGIVHEFFYNERKENRAGEKAVQPVYLVECSRTSLEPRDPDSEIHGWFRKEEVPEELTFKDSARVFLEATDKLA